ncbi:EF-hand domain-containing protein [Marinobacterium rhizophilum]|uniref:EF-hand domain-containing protein n=1 Tax=Marinobacterium rhizophilum TaxID=420402 RepID=A0ABY5HNJ8_9GAMM|nr:EF-hand domain-containing protein [Marinobacterium rhizophilum]UTW12471.1 EF-hand domain-containing protein [Marinobacterium rhizophilum]
MRTLTATLGAALLTTCATLHADPVQTLFQELDVDNDGKLSWQESSAYADLKTYFTSLDANQDGYLTPFEFGVQQRSQS